MMRLRINGGRLPLETLRKKVLMPGLESVNETVLSAPSAQQIVESCETLPMMSEPRPDVRHPGAVRIAVFILPAPRKPKVRSVMAVCSPVVFRFFLVL